MRFSYNAHTADMDSPILVPMALPLSQQARARIKAWVASTHVSQAALGERIGKDQVWMSRYLSGHLEADIDTLHQIAAAFGHTLSALVEIPKDQAEAQLVEDWRAATPRMRQIVSSLLTEARRSRTKPRARR